MSRRIKLTTEWAEWRFVNQTLCLSGAADYIAVIVPLAANKLELRIYDSPYKTDTGWRYNSPMHGGICDSQHNAVEACEQFLLTAGLIDPMWWVAQCPKE